MLDDALSCVSRPTLIRTGWMQPYHQYKFYRTPGQGHILRVMLREGIQDTAVINDSRGYLIEFSRYLAPPGI